MADTLEVVDLHDLRDELFGEQRAVYDAVPTDRPVGVDEVRELLSRTGRPWRASRGQLAHALRAMREDGLLAGSRGRFRRVALEARPGDRPARHPDGPIAAIFAALIEPSGGDDA